MQVFTISAFIISVISLIHTASFTEESSSCVTDCPEAVRSGSHCGSKRQLVLTPRTCYKCPKYKCVKKKYLKKGGSKICTKHIPHCGDECSASETCFVTVQTFWSCSKAKCVSKIGNLSRVEDYEL